VLYVHLLTHRCERSKIVGASGEHGDGTVMVAALDLVHRYSDLQDALVKPPDWTTFTIPEIFERFMLRKKISAVELFDASDQERRRRFVARTGHGRIMRWPRMPVGHPNGKTGCSLGCYDAPVLHFGVLI